MNPIHLFRPSFFDHQILTLHKRLSSSLSRQQHICLIAAFALSCLASIYLIIHYCFNEKKQAIQNVKELNFCHLQDLGDKELQKIHQKLEKINLAGCFKLNPHVIKQLPEDLRELSIYFGKHLSDYLEYFPKGLKILHLFYCNQLTNEDIKNIPRSLEELFLLNCVQLSEEGIENLPPLLKKLKLLNAFQFTNEAIKKLPQCLEELHLYDCGNLTDDALNDLPQSLKTLYLNDSHPFSALALVELSEKIKVVQH